MDAERVNLICQYSTGETRSAARRLSAGCRASGRSASLYRGVAAGPAGGRHAGSLNRSLYERLDAPLDEYVTALREATSPHG